MRLVLATLLLFLSTSTYAGDPASRVYKTPERKLPRTSTDPCLTPLYASLFKSLEVNPHRSPPSKDGVENKASTPPGYVLKLNAYDIICGTRKAAKE